MQSQSSDKSPTERQKCSYWVKRKNRSCKMFAMAGLSFCAEHSNENTPLSDGKKRIPCPLDPKHSTFQHKLKSHLEKCNANRTDMPPYEIPRFNCADVVEETTIPSLQCDETVVVIRKILKIYHEHRLKSLVIDESSRCNQYLKTLVNDPDSNYLGDKKKHNLLQIGSLLYQLEKHSALKKDTNFIELGAGKGGLAYWLKECLLKSESETNLSNTNVVLVDMASHRHKMDSRQSEALYPKFTRLRVNLEDLALDQVSVLRDCSNPVVAVSKHLCGDATDLSLRCLKNFLLPSYESAAKIRRLSDSSSGNRPANLTCVVIALCCHHRCTWSQFVGRKHFGELGLTGRDFAFVRAMSSWATCNFKARSDGNTVGKDLEEFPDLTTDDIQSITTFKNLSNSKKEFIGLVCKRLLDWSRINFVTSELKYSVELCKYVTKHSSLENIALVAYK